MIYVIIMLVNTMLKFKINISKEEYDAFINQHPFNNLLQSYRWGIVKNQSFTPYYLGLYKDEQLIATALLLTKKILRFFTMFYICKGPLFLNYEEESFAFFQKELKHFARKKQAILIKIAPAEILCTYKPNEEECKEHPYQFLDTLYKKHHYITNPLSKDLNATIEPRITMVTDLTKEPLLKGFHSSVKSSIKLCEKHCVEIMESDDLHIFYDLMVQTGKRDAFNIRPYSYFRHLKDSLQEQCKLFYARLNIPKEYHQLQTMLKQFKQRLSIINDSTHHECKDLNDQIIKTENLLEQILPYYEKNIDYLYLSSALMTYQGNISYYLYAASNNEVRGINASSYLVYQTMLDSQKNGYHYYDFGGVSGYQTKEEDPHHYGLYEFKRKFNTQYYCRFMEYNYSNPLFLAILKAMGKI